MTTVTCPCGATFERKPQRGRPAIWCERCRSLPMNQRAERPIVTDDDGEPQEARVSRHGVHDDMSYDDRERIEMGVLEVNRRYREEIIPNKAKLFKGKAGLDQSAACLEWLHVAVYKVYHEVDPRKWPKSSLIGFDWNIA